MNPDQFTRGLKNTLQETRRRAEEQGQAEYGLVEHLLVLLDQQNSLPVRVLRNLGVPVGELRDELINRAVVPIARGPIAVPDGAARQALERAQALAAEQNHEWVGMIHLLQAILEDKDDPAGQTLRRYGLDPEKVTAETRRCIQADADQRRRKPVEIRLEQSSGYTFGLRETLRMSRDVARLWRQNRLLPEHLLGAMLHKGAGDGIRILNDCGADLIELSIQLQHQSEIGATPPAGEIALSQPVIDLLDQSEKQARLLEHNEVGTEHLLLAMTQTPTAVRDLLAHFNVTQDKIRTAVGEKRAAPKPSAQPPEQPPTPPTEKAPVQETPAPESPAAQAPAQFATEEVGAAQFAPVTVFVTRIPGTEDLALPEYQTVDSAGIDLRAAVPAAEPFVLDPGRWALVPTGLKIAIPPGYEGQVRPRSGLALKHGIGVLNAPGTIDADYRGEVGIILFNFSSEPFTINRGERIAQLVINRHERLEWIAVDKLPDSHRGEGGFGHTGR